MKDSLDKYINTQKNHGYEIQHLKSKDVNALKNHYILIQIVHIIDN